MPQAVAGVISRLAGWRAALVAGYGWLQHPANLLSAFTSAILIGVLLVYILRYGENIVWSDAIRIIPMAVAIKTGQFRLSDLFVNIGGQYNVFPYLTSAIAIATTGWNIGFEIAINVLIVGVTFALVIALVRRTAPGIALVVAPAAAALLFSVHQDHNWLYAFFGHWFYSNLFFVAAVWLLTSPERTHWRLLGGWRWHLPRRCRQPMVCCRFWRWRWCCRFSATAGRSGCCGGARQSRPCGWPFSVSAAG